ncbi:MAG: DUF3575 domain-containing protein, partial [Porphyromonadaceae bacterium]|nr:DUF3575 domain-containing protein [Porphyromonadaceae bacterium]
MKETRGIGKKRRKTALLLLAGAFPFCSAVHAASEPLLSLPTDTAETALSLSDTLSVYDLPEGWRLRMPEGTLYGIPVTDTIQGAFRQGQTTLEEGFEANRMALARLRSLGSLPLLEKVSIVGSASLEGSVPLNWQLSKQRAETLSDFLKREAGLPDSLVEYGYVGRDWQRLLRLVEADSMVPYQKKMAALLRVVIDDTAEGEDLVLDDVEWLSRVGKGIPYQYMYKNFFPELRRQQCVVRYMMPYIVRRDTTPTPVCVYDTLCVHDTLYIEPSRNYYLSVRTNMLLDAGLAPTIGVELYMGKRWSVAAEWTYAWWKS